MNDGDEWDVLTFKGLLTYLHFPIFLFGNCVKHSSLMCFYTKLNHVYIGKYKLWVSNMPQTRPPSLRISVIWFSPLPQSYQILLITFFTDMEMDTVNLSDLVRNLQYIICLQSSYALFIVLLLFLQLSELQEKSFK